MISTIHRYRSTLPGKRVELYAEICEVFLGKRQQARGMKIDLRPAQCVSVLQPLAYAMMKRELREITAKDAQEAIKNALKLVSEQMTPKDFLQMVEDMSGLLLEREQGIYGFAHLTFQEYLAATYIREQGLEAILIAHVGESWWAETTRLYCAQTDATNVIEACHNHAAPSIAHLMLALECSEEALKVQPVLKSHMDKLIEQEVEDPDPRYRRVIAETLLRRRLKEMLPVGEGVYKDTSLILHAEYQLFLDEQRAQSKYYQPDHWIDVQFPQEQALLPVMGVRPSDAQAFCGWLTERAAGGGWWYRLPKPSEYQPEEVYARPAWLPSCSWDVPHGYWLDEHVFEWIKQPMFFYARVASQPELLQAGALDLDMFADDVNIAVEVAVKIVEGDAYLVYLNRAYARAHVLALALTSERDRFLARVLSRALASATNPAFPSERDRSLVRASTSAIDLTFALTNESDLALDLTRALEYDSARARVLNEARDYASALSNVLVGNFTRASDLDFALANARALAIDLARIAPIVFNLWRIEGQHTSYSLDLAQLLALLSICMSFCALELAEISPDLPSQPFWKSLFARWEKRGKQPLEPQMQQTLSQGIEIYHRLERLEKRRQGKEQSCEGILIIRERKQG